MRGAISVKHQFSYPAVVSANAVSASSFQCLYVKKYTIKIYKPSYNILCNSHKIEKTCNTVLDTEGSQ